MSERSPLEAEKARNFLADWNARHLARYAEQVERGEHDSDCEQRVRSSLCHCSKRKREREGKTHLPTITFHTPTCGDCYGSLSFDGDVWECATCRVVWDANATDGDQADRFTDDHGDEQFGGEQFGERLLGLVNRSVSKGGTDVRTFAPTD